MAETKALHQEPKYNELKQVYVANNNMEAEIIISILDANGIPAFKTYDSSGDYMNLYMGASMQGVNILVSSGDLEAAQLIVNDIQLENPIDSIYEEVGMEELDRIDESDIEAEMKLVEANYNQRKKKVRIFILAILVVVFSVIILYALYASGNLL